VDEFREFAGVLRACFEGAAVEDDAGPRREAGAVDAGGHEP